MNNNGRMFTYASRILSFVIVLMVTRLQLALIKLKEMREPTNLHDSDLLNANVITSIILPPVGQSSCLFFATLAYLSTILRTRRKLFFIARCICNNGSHMLLSFSRFFSSSIDAQNRTWSQLLGPFTSEFSFCGTRRHQIADKLIVIINVSRLYGITLFLAANKYQFACSHYCFVLRATPHQACIYY